MKRLFALLLTLTLLTLPAYAVEPSGVSAKAALLMDCATGTVLWEENCEEQLEPASVTKIMTMLLTVEAMDRGTIHAEDMVSVSAHAASMGGSQVFLEEGEKMSVHDLLKSVAVASGNDAAVALAEYVGGSEEAFVEQMNRRAEELGMEHTHFCNCNGLPAADHLTCARDIALMSRELLRHDSIRPYVGIWMDSIRGGDFQLSNTNKLIRYYDGATGLKTGSTDSAGFCISATACRENLELIAVVLGSKTSAERFNSAKAMLDFGFSQYTLVDAAPKELPAIPVALGEESCVASKLEGNCLVVVRKDQMEAVETAVDVVEQVDAPIKAGDSLGSVKIKVEGKCVKTVHLVAAKNVERLTFKGVWKRMWGKMAMQE